MTRDEAIHLVRLAETYWPEKPWSELDRQTWIDDLGPLDAGAGGTTMVRLHRAVDKRPTWKVFHDSYRQVHTASVDRGCDGCSDGWVELADGTVRPCRCHTGTVRADAHAQAARHNAIAERRQTERAAPMTVDEARAFAELGRQALEAAAAGRPLPDPEMF